MKNTNSTSTRQASCRPVPEFVLFERDRKAIELADGIFDITPDPVELMKQLMLWPEPPQMDERWIKKLAVVCEMTAAYAKLAHNYKIEAERARYRLPIPAEPVVMPGLVARLWNYFGCVGWTDLGTAYALILCGGLVMSNGRPWAGLFAMVIGVIVFLKAPRTR